MGPYLVLGMRLGRESRRALVKDIKKSFMEANRKLLFIHPPFYTLNVTLFYLARMNRIIIPKKVCSGHVIFLSGLEVHFATYAWPTVK